jgi:hypothetical protein
VVGQTEVFRVPFRNTRQISMAAHSFIQADDNLRQNEEFPVLFLDSFELPAGTPPRLVRCSSIGMERSLVEAEVRKLLETGSPQMRLPSCVQAASTSNSG